mmetsp:Transcript_3623/g.6877  ORF Transcript_3623/g.6877 Transcript_3623/m.6877 type:complete len:359 (-) Transcript_3623:79-1155(-)
MAEGPQPFELDESSLLDEDDEDGSHDKSNPPSRTRRLRRCCLCCCAVFLLPFVALILFVLIYPMTLGEVRQEWGEYLHEAAPQIIRNHTKTILDRAQSLVANATLISKDDFPFDLDVVVSGGGFLSYYWLGVHTILDVYEKKNHTRLHRFSGASAGAQEPFKRVCMSHDSLNPHKHLETALSFAFLVENHKDRFSNDLYSAVAADVLWKDLAEFLSTSYLSNSTVLKELSGTVFIQVTLLKPWFSGKLISEYSSALQAKQAFVATGSAFVNYQGTLAVDGGGTDCAPHFKDGKRSQLVVMLTKSGLPMRMVARILGMEDVLSAIEIGQQDAIKFLGGEDVEALEIKDELTQWSAFGCM